MLLTKNKSFHRYVLIVSLTSFHFIELQISSENRDFVFALLVGITAAVIRTIFFFFLSDNKVHIRFLPLACLEYRERRE